MAWNHLRRRHLLALEDEPRQFETDASVVDHERSVALSVSGKRKTKDVEDTRREDTRREEREKKGEDLLSAKAMSLPVRPPTRPSAVDRPRAAPARAGPAAVATRERPWEALAETSAAACRALAAASVVEVEVEVEVDCSRRGAARRAWRVGVAIVEGRSSGRIATEADMSTWRA